MAIALQPMKAKLKKLVTHNRHGLHTECTITRICKIIVTVAKTHTTFTGPGSISSSSVHKSSGLVQDLN